MGHLLIGQTTCDFVAHDPGILVTLIRCSGKSDIRHHQILGASAPTRM
ncbi:MAG: hypothetical protein KDI50_06380 [Candidatus Competibacteraceae bacterium]|nr:hypothetical protein [Candidatus Competibacteraceae bacterium]